MSCSHSHYHTKQISPPVQVSGYAVGEKKEGELVSFQTIEQQISSLEPLEVFVEVIASSICYTDIHTLHSVGVIPGHEIVGIVRYIGEQVETEGKIIVGMRVGMGWHYTSCFECATCNNHFENLCDKTQPFYKAPIGGGFQTGVVWDSRFVFPIPDKLKSIDAAPLLCAGATVYSPLHYYRESPYSSKDQFVVAVLGLGGLGHLALQFAKKMGFHVVALSTNPSKEEECRSFGADEFHVHTDENVAKSLGCKFDMILNTVSTDIETEKFVQMLKPFGKLVMLGFPDSGVYNVSAFSLILKDRFIVGSASATPDLVNEMLKFAADHEIKPKLELTTLEKVTPAVEKVLKNQARYRVVMVVNQELVDKEN